MPILPMGMLPGDDRREHEFHERPMDRGRNQAERKENLFQSIPSLIELGFHKVAAPNFRGPVEPAFSFQLAEATQAVNVAIERPLRKVLPEWFERSKYVSAIFQDCPIDGVHRVPPLVVATRPAGAGREACGNICGHPSVIWESDHSFPWFPG